MPRHRWVRWALGVVVALLVARWMILVPLLLPGVISLRVLELLPRSFTDKLAYYLAPQTGTAANLVIAEVMTAAGLFWMAVFSAWAWRRNRAPQSAHVKLERMPKISAVLLALLVPFIVQYLFDVGDIRFLPERQLPPPLPPLEVFGLLQWFLTASTGFVFVARAFRRPYAAAIGVAYYPLMMIALWNFGIGLLGGGI